MLLSTLASPAIAAPAATGVGIASGGATALTPQVATPVISPAAGTITSAQSITITDATQGATIYYYTTGAVFTNQWVQYTGPIPLEGSGDLTIQAYASVAGDLNSNTASTTYTLIFPSAATPVISLAPGLYSGTQTATISDTTPGATIYYTTDGSYPYTYSNAYSGSITISTSEILTAAALAPGYALSRYAIAQYDIASSSSRFIYTIAGNDTFGYTGDGGPATFAELRIMQGVAVDSSGNVYISDSEDNVVRKVAATTGIITTIAGTGVAGDTGNNGPAADAELWTPTALAVDGQGNLFIGETGDNVIRRIDAVTGSITMYAGNPAGTGSIGGPANNYPLYSIVGLACDVLYGNLYIAEEGDVLKVNNGNGNITEIAGWGTGAGFGLLNGITVDQAQNIYVSDSASSVVRKIAPNGTITVFAGGGYLGDGGPATNARLDYPAGLAVDSAGNVYIADNWDSAIREVNPAGIISTVAGHLDNSYADGSDGSPATSVGIFLPQAIAADPAGNVYFGDQDYYRVRKITAPAPPPSSIAATPVFSLAAGTYSGSQILTMSDDTPGAEIYVSLNGNAPTTASQGYHGPIDITGTVTVQAIALAPGYLTSAPKTATYTITTPPTAVISTVAGTGGFGFLGAGGPATSALIGQPEAVAFDGQENLYIADSENAVVWMVAASSGNISVVAGTGTSGAGTDGVLATASELNGPQGIALDKSGNLYIADTSNGRIRMVNAETGVITTVAGPGVSNTLGDGGPATSAYLGYPDGLAFDGTGNLYIADGNLNRIRMIAANTGTISTVAGGGTAGQLGDGGLATAAWVSYPQDVTADKSGNLYIVESGDSRIRKVEASTGVITTIAGNGMAGITGDGGQATAAEVDLQQGIAVDGAGDVYFSDWPGALRKVDAVTGVITTIAGDGYFGFGGDGGAATMAELFAPRGLALNSTGSIFVADAGNYRIRKVTFTPTVAVLTSPAPGLSTTLGANNVVFTWTTAAGATDYQLNLSAVSPGASDLYSYKGTATTATAPSLPTNGAEVYATLYTKSNGVWQSNSYVYYESGPRLAALTSPTPGLGTILGTGSVTFQWTTGAEVADYQLNLSAIGQGQSELFSYKGTATSAVVSSLPANGATVYATLYSKINGAWQSIAYQYTESGTPTPAVLTSPTPGLTTILGTSSVLFQWTAGGGASEFQLNLSAITPGASDLFVYKGTASSATVPSLPAHGVTVFATLYSKIKGTWQSNSYVYTESGSPTPGALTSPTPGLGTILGTSNVLFQWSAGTSASLYQLNLSTVAPGDSELYSYKGTALSATAPSLPANGVKVYARLYSKIDGNWLYNDYVYTEQ